MLPGTYDRLIEVPDGHQAALATLGYMAGIVDEPSPTVDSVAGAMAAGAASAGLGPHETAERIFEWVQGHMLYMPDFNGRWLPGQRVVEEVRKPSYTLYEISLLGSAVGDCDDYVVLLAALYKRLGYPVKFIAVSTHADRMLDHVFMAVETDQGWTTADGIVCEPFGWEVPQGEQTNRVEWPA